MRITIRTMLGFTMRSIDCPLKSFTFSAGEQHVVLSKALQDIGYGDEVIIETEIRSAEDFMLLVMVKDAVSRCAHFKIPVKLIMLYVPYGRQDRACEAGEAFGLKAFASMLNTLEFDEVVIADPHSDVTPALIERLTVIPQEEIVKQMLGVYIPKEDFAIVSPDAGALKKIFKVAKELGGADVYCAEKIRDTSTGAIKHTDIAVKDFKGRNLIMVDDICDGGYTFIKLAELLRSRNAGRIDLYVTHGIFSKGLRPLEGTIDRVHSLNVWKDNIEADQDILVLNQGISRNVLLSKYYN